MNDSTAPKTRELRQQTGEIKQQTGEIKEQTGEIKQQTGELKRSTKAVEVTTTELTELADRRTVLSLDRTLYAAERTYAAWVRTGLAALASGVGARALLKDVLPGIIGKLTGTVLIAFAGFCMVAAVWRELRGIKTRRTPDVRPLPRALMVPTNAFLLLVAIAAMVGIWSA